MVDIPPSSQATKPVAWWHWHRRLYNWVIAFADSPHGGWALAIISFADSIFLPMPPDVLLAPLTLGAPRKWFRFSMSCTIASVFGGIVGYLIGMLLWAAIGEWAYANLAFLGLTEENFIIFKNWYDRYDFWIVFIAGFTPLPYQVCTISAGVARISLPGFLIASTVSRAARFFLVAGLIGWQGERIRPLIEKYFDWLSLAFAVLLIGGFVLVKWLH